LLRDAKNSQIVRRRKRTAALAEELHGKIDDVEDGAFEEAYFPIFKHKNPYWLEHLNFQGLMPDGIADTRGHLSENKTGDGSHEEEWSSFSSSEETLMQCEGLLLYLPLTARASCSSAGAAATATAIDSYSYTAPTAGYYFFVFNSENEIQENLISVQFSLARTTYNTSRRVAQCDNTTACAFPLDFFSSEKVVLEVPVAPGRHGPAPTNDSSPDSLAKHWNEEYLVVSTCEPRTSLYLVCMLLVPILILAFAFQ
jgi:peptidyl-prolyl cis-trans isomerase SDCCAG10